MPKNRKIRYAAKLPLAFILALSLGANASAQKFDTSDWESYRFYDEEGKERYYTVQSLEHPELLLDGYYVDGSYDLIYRFAPGYDDLVPGGTYRWWADPDDISRIFFSDPHYSESYSLPPCNELTVRIPNTVNGVTVTEFYKSGEFKAFDVDPNNEYFKSDGRAVLSKDGKKLLSFAMYNEAARYTVPKGTEIIGEYAFHCCRNLKKLRITEDVKVLEPFSLSLMGELEEIVFESFDIKADKTVFGEANSPFYTKAKLRCTETVQLSREGTLLKWGSVKGATGYELYRKSENGRYKKLKTLKGTTCRLKGLAKGKEYTYAVRPFAVIPTEGYDPHNKEDAELYTQSINIQGRLSDGITIVNGGS